MSDWYSQGELPQIAVVNDLVLSKISESDPFWTLPESEKEIMQNSADSLSPALSIRFTIMTWNQIEPVYTASPAYFDSMMFQELASSWLASRNQISSFAADLLRDPYYVRIIGMGPRAVPYILSRLRDELRKGEPNHWFPALWAITGENPIPKEDRGRIVRMSEAWLRWGAEKGYIHHEGLGREISKPR